MDEKNKQAMQQLYEDTNDYELRALLHNVHQYFDEQDYRLALSQMQLDGETWDKSNW